MVSQQSRKSFLRLYHADFVPWEEAMLYMHDTTDALDDCNMSCRDIDLHLTDDDRKRCALMLCVTCGILIDQAKRLSGLSYNTNKHTKDVLEEDMKMVDEILSMYTQEDCEYVQ